MSTSTAGPVACEPRTAFVLAGGAALGAMQAGMIHALYERGIAPDLLIGTSAGALNAAFLASRPPTVATAQELAALWRGLRRRDILPLRPATLLSGLAGRRDHLIPHQALRRLAARHLQFERLEQAAIPPHLAPFYPLPGPAPATASAPPGALTTGALRPAGRPPPAGAAGPAGGGRAPRRDVAGRTGRPGDPYGGDPGPVREPSGPRPRAGPGAGPAAAAPGLEACCQAGGHRGHRGVPGKRGTRRRAMGGHHPRGLWRTSAPPAALRAPRIPLM